MKPAFGWYCATHRCARQWKKTHRRTCPGCGERTRPNTAIESGKSVMVMPDVPTHYNESFDTVVNGRRHLKALQREHGTKDWEPMNSDSPAGRVWGKSGR